MAGAERSDSGNDDLPALAGHGQEVLRPRPHADELAEKTRQLQLLLIHIAFEEGARMRVDFEQPLENRACHCS